MSLESPKCFQDAGRFKPIPCLIDEMAAVDPSKPLFSIPRSSEPYYGYADITSSVFARAVNRCAWWLEGEIGKSQNFETVPYFGPQDLGYMILVLALVKTGYVMLLCHPGTNADDTVGLLEVTKCRRLLHRGEPALFAQVLQKRQLGYHKVPPLNEWLKDGDDSIYEYDKPLAEVWTDPFVVVNSSGSTGNPKPIRLTHASVVAQARYQTGPEDRDSLFRRWSHRRVLLFATCSVAVGFYCLLGVNLYFDWIMVMPPAMPLTAELLYSLDQHATFEVCAAPPRSYAESAQRGLWIDSFSRLQTLAYTGGPCPTRLGEKLASRARLTTLLGSSETGPVATDILSPEDWQYVKFDQSFPHRLDSIHDDLFELVVTRDDASPLGTETTRPLQTVFYTYPKIHEYRTTDLYSKHPQKQGLWLYRGRRNDLITLLDSVSGTTTLMFPLALEQTLSDLAEVKFAMVYGARRSRPALLIQPTQELLASGALTGTKEFIDGIIWPIVKEHNKVSPQKLRISRELVQLTDPQRPFITNVKNSMSREMTAERYKTDLDLLYAKATDVE